MNSDIENSEITETLRTLLEAIHSGMESGEISQAEAISTFKQMLDAMTEFFTDTFATILSVEERRHMIATGVRSQGFVSVCRENVRLSPHLLPSDLSPDKIEEDYADLEQKQSVHDIAKRLASIACDTQLASSDVVRHNSLIYYQAAKHAAKRKVAGAKNVYDNMSPYFKRGGRKPG